MDKVYDYEKKGQRCVQYQLGIFNFFIIGSLMLKFMSNPRFLTLSSFEVRFQSVINGLGGKNPNGLSYTQPMGSNVKTVKYFPVEYKGQIFCTFSIQRLQCYVG